MTIADSSAILDDCHTGDSIAVNGACLTVTEFDKTEHGGWFKVWLANETLARTDLGACVYTLSDPFSARCTLTGHQVIKKSAARSTWNAPWAHMCASEGTLCKYANTQRGLSLSSFIYSYRWQAHVDTTATITAREPDGDSLRLAFTLPPPSAEVPSLMRYIVPKGYVAIDGASLTVTRVDDAARTFGVMLIQHTQEKITLARKAVGERVNIEVDMVGKYVEKSVSAALGGEGSASLREMVRGLVEELLAEKK